jgi:iron(III) transport system permease protein
MTEQIRRNDVLSGAAPARRVGRVRPDGWSAAAVGIAALVLLPVASVLWFALDGSGDTWAHLVRTALPRYVLASFGLALATGLVAGVIGTATAWLVTMYRFPGVRTLSWLLLMPLAVPAYVAAYALVDLFDYAGPVQVALRDAFGWTDARAYWFPHVRSFEGAVMALALALYPYVYLLARTALLAQSGCAHDVARALGAGPWGRFWRLGLPLARPAIAVGIAIVMMETLNDYGTVRHFGINTMTTGIFTLWLQAGNRAAAAQLACVMLAVVIALVLAERHGRSRLAHHGLSRSARPVVAARLAGWRAVAATAVCTLPVLLGFVLPVGGMLRHAIAGQAGGWLDPGLLRAAANTLAVGGSAAVLTVTAALVMVYGVRLSGHALPRRLLPVTTIGYAAPGAVLAVGLLFPMAALDHRLADAVLALTGTDPGLILTGTAAAIVLAFAVRFFAIAQGAVDAAMGQVSPSLPMAARSLGRGRTATLGVVYLPLIRAPVAAALLLVFVDCVKELPATLLLRPFNFDTLATRIHGKATLEDLGAAAPAALLVILVGLSAVLLLARGMRDR